MTQPAAGSPGPEIVVYVSPQLRCDLIPYYFYRHAPDHYLLDVVHRPVDSYSPNQGPRLFETLDSSVVREPGLTTQLVIGGSALSFSYAWADLIAACSELSQRLGVPVITDMVAVVTALAGRPGPIVVLHRLADIVDEQILRFFESAGIECLGVCSEPASPAANVATSLAHGSEHATRLVRQGIDQHPGADTVVLLGGSWWIDQAQVLAEREGKGFVNNLSAVMLPLAGQHHPSTTSSTQRKREL
jgi:hypothetical protein